MPTFEDFQGDILKSRAGIWCCAVDDVGTLKGLCWKFCQCFEGFEDWYLELCKNDSFHTTSLHTKSFKIGDRLVMVALVHCKDWEGNCDAKSLKLGLFELKEILLYLDENAKIAIPPLGHTTKHQSLSKQSILGLIKEVFWNTSCTFELYNF